MENTDYLTIKGRKNGQRIESRLLEEALQAAVADGHRRLKVEAFGQHGIGGRLWKAGDETVHLRITGPPGQRTGSLGFPNTFIEVDGPASDDVGWLNAGAEILVRGNAANGAANAMAQGRIWVDGNIGARGMTMTKYNPRFEPPELWVLGSVGDYFGEFMAGGVSVVCGHNPQNPENILGHRPLVGMVGGKVFFRGPHKGYSQVDAKLAPIADDDWDWLTENLKGFLEKIGRTELYDGLADRTEWQLLTAKTPLERLGKRQRSMKAFREEIWETELGAGGLIGDLTDLERSPIGVITTGEMRRYVPVWENKKYLAPCEATCPTGIPVQERWRLIREGRVDEAVDLALSYTPFPATVCGYLCPNLCMSECTRQSAGMAAVDVAQLGRASVAAGIPDLPPATGHRVAVIGGGPAGISTAWQLRRTGHETVIHDLSKKLGGKIASVIPDSRIPAEVLEKELERVDKMLPHVHLGKKLDRKDLEAIKADYDFVVVAVGAQKPRVIPIPGHERMIPALDFLAKAKGNGLKPGRRVVIIGAGNVGCDVAAEAHRLGAEEITLIDIQEPASFGKEREHAEAVGATFKWPVFTQEITEEGVLLKSGELLPADTVIISIGDAPDLDFLPETVEIDRGFVRVDETYRTTDDKIFAIGDAVKPGLLTDAIGAGRKAARAISDLIDTGTCSTETMCDMIDKRRVSLEYFDPRINAFDDLGHCGTQCSSCGACRDCGLCVEICPQTAIRRETPELSTYEYVVDPDRCIGCGFCAGACPCGVWNLVENETIG